ncbi:MAG: SET domain-containing protein-lysine N-methyltransferase [Opitutales bacterium]
MRPSTLAGAGLGLFAEVAFEEDEPIGPYTGELITYEELAAGRFAGSDYLLGLTARYLIAGEGPQAGPTRYINHSRQPNAWLIVSTRWKTARFVACRRIEPGEEIFFDYGEAYWTASRESARARD